MTLASPRPVAASKLEGVSKLDRVEPIVASDAEIASAVAGADLPALLAALSVLANDASLIADDLRPPPSKMGASIKPQGGMSQQAQDKARSLALRTLIDYRDRGSQPPDPAPPLLERAMQFLAHNAGSEYLPLLKSPSRPGC